jgi:hypothetical protein
MLHFDDAFVHSVSNPHPTEFRVVLAIVTLHPDLVEADEQDITDDEL